MGGKTNLAKVEGLRARPWLKPGPCLNGGQYNYDGDEDDHSKPWWRRRLRSLYMAAMSFSPSTFRIAISLLLLVAIGTAFTFLPVEQAISLSLFPALLISISRVNVVLVIMSVSSIVRMDRTEYYWSSLDHSISVWKECCSAARLCAL